MFTTLVFFFQNLRIIGSRCSVAPSTLWTSLPDDDVMSQILSSPNNWLVPLSSSSPQQLACPSQFVVTSTTGLSLSVRRHVNNWLVPLSSSSPQQLACPSQFVVTSTTGLSLSVRRHLNNWLVPLSSQQLACHVIFTNTIFHNML